MSENEGMRRVCPIIKDECIVTRRCAIFDCHRAAAFLAQALDQLDSRPFAQSRIDPDDWAYKYEISHEEFREYITNLRSKGK